MLPCRRLCDRKRIERAERFPRAEGMAPVRVLELRFKWKSLGREPSSGGISPPSSFPPKLMTSSCKQLPKLAGIFPWSLFLFKLRRRSSEQLPRVDGISPLKELKLRLRYCKRGRRPSSGGMFPWSQLLGRWSLVRKARSARRGDMVPLSWRPSRASSVTRPGGWRPHVTPRHRHNGVDSFQEAVAPSGSSDITDLKERRASLSAAPTSKEDGELLGEPTVPGAAGEHMHEDKESSRKTACAHSGDETAARNANPMKDGSRCLINPQGTESSLYYLNLYENSLEGSIPNELGRMTNLEVLDVFQNRLSGNLPASVYNLSYLRTLHVGYNQLSGFLLQDLGNRLPALRNLHLFGNRFEGPLPLSLSNATGLEVIELAHNRFRGLIPSNLGTLQYLQRLVLGNNSFEAREANDWSFITSLTNCSNLRVLELYDNRLGGVLPSSIANLSTQLESLMMERNQITGSIPVEIEKIFSLTKLHMSRNLLTGALPATIGKLQNLRSLQLDGNRLSGGIPSSLGNLSQLESLLLGGNQLEGGIPISIGSCRNLATLNLSYNRLNDTIPKEVLSLSSLSKYLDLSHNYLIGNLPFEIGMLKNLNQLDVSKNKLSGEIPDTIGECEVLEYLHLQGNLFEGSIPQALSDLKGLRDLDLSFNRLSGHIPEFLENLNLLNLNLSSNDFDGEVPKKGIFQNVSAVSLHGNNKLCGGIPVLNLQACPINDLRRRKNSNKLKIVVSVVSVVLFLALLSSFIIFHFMKKSRNKFQPSESLRKHLSEVSYAELRRATEGFASSNLIGVGGYGSVYKGKLVKDTEYVAVKVLNLKTLGASRSFLIEYDALKNIRHRNLIKIVTSCSTVDFEGNEFKALVFEFMPNGSLEEWLHPGDSDHPTLKSLSFVQRLNVAIDVASAIDYLHHYAPISIIHSDLKPSNVLLDEHMTAHVGDFGLARFLSSKRSHYATCSVGLKGTIGYIAPEFGMVTKVSTSIDVFSFGILLLEMFTGKKPTDPIFKDGLTLHKYVQNSIPSQVMNIVDPKLLSQEGTGTVYGLRRTEKMRECLVSVFKLGIMCSKESQRERAKIGDIIRVLILTRNFYLGDEFLGEEHHTLSHEAECHLLQTLDEP